MAGGDKEGGKGKDGGGGGDNTGKKQGGVYRVYGGVQLEDGGRSGPDGVQGGATTGGGHIAGSGTDSQGRKVLTWHWPCGGDVEGSGRDFKSPTRGLHHRPPLPQRISGGSRHRYRHPRGQATSEYSGLEIGGPVRDLPGHVQGVWRIGHVQVPGDIGGVRRGPPIPEATTDILEATNDGCKGEQLLQDFVPRSAWGDAGRSALPHHI